MDGRGQPAAQLAEQRTSAARIQYRHGLAAGRLAVPHLRRHWTALMHDLPHTRLRPLADASTAAVVAGFIAMLTGYTSSLVLMFQAGQAAGLTNGQISSWIWALSIGM